MRMQRLFALIMAMLMAISVLAGCASTKDTTTEATQTQTQTQVVLEPKEKLPVRFVMPGDPLPDEELVEKAINKKMLEDGVNLELKALYVPWDVWEQKTNLMMNTGEPFELLQVMDSWISAASIVGRGGIVPIGSAYLDKYGPNIKKVVPDWAFEAGKINGKIYTIPAFTVEPAVRTGFITYRKDLFDKNNIAIPKSPEELSTAIETIIKSEKDKKYMYVPDDSDQQEMLHRWYDSFPFIVYDQLLFIKNDGTVKSWVETEEFKKDAAFNRKLYVNGIISPDILSLKDDIKQNAYKNSLYPVDVGEGLGWWPQQKLNTPEAVFEDFLVAPEKPLLRSEAYTNSNAISATSANPEAGVMFFNWVYANQENYDLLHYGIKDTHWKDLGERKIEPINPDKPTYSYPTWMSESVSFMRFSKDIHPTLELINTLKFPGIKYDDTTNFITLGFRFDTTPVATEYANCMSEANTTFRPLANGVTDYDKNYPKALAKMKAAGIDKVVAEYDKQLKAFVATKKK